jgi:hypothetical protein
VTCFAKIVLQTIFCRVAGAKGAMFLQFSVGEQAELLLHIHHHVNFKNLKQNIFTFFNSEF